MFSRSADLYDAIYAFKDYSAEVETLDRLIRARVPDARTLLDVACGTGKHLELLAGRYEVEGLDLRSCSGSRGVGFRACRSTRRTCSTSISSACSTR